MLDAECFKASLRTLTKGIAALAWGRARLPPQLTLHPERRLERLENDFFETVTPTVFSTAPGRAPGTGTGIGSVASPRRHLSPRSLAAERARRLDLCMREARRALVGLEATGLERQGLQSDIASKQKQKSGVFMGQAAFSY